MRGDSSTMTYTNNKFTSLSGEYIVYPISIAPFSQNSPLDELRLAFSLITKNSSGSVPDKINICDLFTLLLDHLMSLRNL